MRNQPPTQPLTQKIAKLQGDLGTLVQVLVKGLNRQLSRYNVDAVEHTILGACMAAGPIAIRDLKKLVPIDSGHMSRTTTELQNKGLMQKMRLMDDQRLVRLRVTEEGAAIIPELMRQSQEYYALLLRGIGHERLAGCIAVMEKMITADDSSEPPSDGEGKASGMAEPPQSQSIESLIGKLQSDMTSLINVLFTGIQERVSPHGFAVAEYSVFATCFANERITISGLAEHIPVDVGRISRMVSKLEDRRLIRKVRVKGNRRLVRVEVTDKGRALALELMGSVGEHYSSIVSKVTEQELTDLMGVIETMTTNATESISAGEEGGRS